MPNHYHFYLESPLGNLSRFMQNLESRYTQRFNRKYKRVGPLFQGRYKSILIDKENYSLEISRYIHLNPVKAKIVNKPEDYQWSSYSALIGLREPEIFLERKWLLSQMGSAASREEEFFHQFTLQGLGDKWDPSKEARGGSVLGKNDFIRWVREKMIPSKRDRSISRLRELQKPTEISHIEKRIEALSTDPKIKKKLLIYCLKKYTPLSLKEIGEKVGGLSDTAVCQTVRRLEEGAQTSPHLLSLIDKLEFKIC
ncbi:MAG: transposase, partial [Elusimicrobia bacterium]|nr:transposase [Elusimicrobiota bacterium]